MKSLYVFVFVALLLGISGCKGSDEGLESDLVTLTATIDQSLTGATKVVAISSGSAHRLVNITNNQFSIVIDNGLPWTLLFLTENNEQLGHIKITTTIESLPMYYAPGDITSINLGSLSKNGVEFIPDLNPLQTSIPLSGIEQLAVGQSDDWFAASANNLDIDGNGNLDFQEGKEYSIGVLYFINGGTFLSGNIPTLDTTGFVNGFKLIVHIKEDALPSSIYVTGPSGSGLLNALTTEQNNYGDYIDFFIPMVNWIFPPGGDYKITYNSKNLTFSIPDQSYILNNIIIPWPTVNLNPKSTINSIS